MENGTFGISEAFPRATFLPGGQKFLENCTFGISEAFPRATFLPGGQKILENGTFFRPRRARVGQGSSPGGFVVKSMCFAREVSIKVKKTSRRSARRRIFAVKTYGFHTFWNSRPPATGSTGSAGSSGSTGSSGNGVISCGSDPPSTRAGFKDDGS